MVLAAAGEITSLLRRAQSGDRAALNEAWELLYRDLHRQASYLMRRERPGHVLQPTALISSAWVRLAGSEPREYNDRKHFVRTIICVMRQVLIDIARAQKAAKNGGHLVRVELDGLIPASGRPLEQIIDFDLALHDLRKLDSRAEEVASMRYFGGMTLPEIAELLEVSLTTVERDIKFASAWLARRFANDESG
jgi:RNA polymerase sigma factor (TIGR02999 family)